MPNEPDPIDNAELPLLKDLIDDERQLARFDPLCGGVDAFDQLVASDSELEASDRKLPTLDSSGLSGDCIASWNLSPSSSKVLVLLLSNVLVLPS